MSEQRDPHPADAVVGARGKPDDAAPGDGADHGGGHGDGHGDGHGGEALGPIDIPAWGAAVLGIMLGLVVVFALVLALT